MAGRPHRGAHKPKERPDPTAFSGEVEASDDFLLDWIGQRTGPRELRQIVVLICGSVEGDPAESESDPEALEEKFAERSRLFGEVTARYGGSITRANIETQIAFWGWPGSSADDTRLAVAAALEIVARLGTSCRCGLDVGIGLADARVLPDSKKRVVAAAFMSARALQRKAGAGEVVVSAMVRKLVADAFDFESQAGPEGRTGATWRVTGATAGRPIGLGSARRLLVGREREIATLVGLWGEVCAGAKRCVHIVGEAGIGKSALVTVLRERVQTQDGSFVEMHCLPETQDMPAVQLMHVLADPSLWGSADAAQVSVAAGSLDCLRPFAEDMVARVVAAIARASRERPLVVVMEDLQWAAPQTVELAAAIAGVGEDGSRLLLIVTGRSELPGALVTRGNWTRIAPARLEPGDVDTMLASGPFGSSLDDAARRQIVERADGVPLFAWELAWLHAEGREAGKDGRLLDGPNRLNAALLARIDATGALKPLVQASAVLGRTFDAGLLAAVLETDVSVLVRRLDELVARGILETTRGAGDGSYTFKHALVWAVAYGSIPSGRRRVVHGRAGYELMHGYRDLGEKSPEVVAGHLDRAGDPAAAFRWWRKAADLAAQTARPAKAIAHIQSALAARAASPACCDVQDEAGLLSLLGRQLGRIRGHASAEAVTVYRRALDMVSTLQSRPAELEFDVQWGLCALHLVAGDTASSLEASANLIEVARRESRDDWLLVAIRLHGTSRLLSGDVRQAIDLFRSVRSLYQPAQHSLLGYHYGSDQAAVALSHLAWAQAVADDEAGSWGAQKDALAFAGRLAHAHTSANVLGILATAAQIRGEVAAAAALARACRDLCDQHGFIYWAVRAQLVSCWADSFSVPERALAEIPGVTRRYRETGSGRAGSLCDCIEAEIALRARRPRLALAALDRGEGSAALPAHRLYSAEVLRLRAIALAALDPGQQEHAIALLLQAESRAVSQDAKAFVRRAVAARAALLRVSGASALERLAAICRLC